jgi:hypothetical protein
VHFDADGKGASVNVAHGKGDKQRLVLNGSRGYAFHLRRAISSPPFHAKFGEVQWPSVLYSRENGLGATLPIRAFNRIFTRRCRIASLISGCSEPFYLEAFDSTYQVFALLIPESELGAIKSSG